MRVAAHHMMRNLTAGMAMITCREPLLMSIATNLKNSFAAALRVGKFFQLNPDTKLIHFQRFLTR